MRQKRSIKYAVIENVLCYCSHVIIPRGVFVYSSENPENYSVASRSDVTVSSNNHYVKTASGIGNLIAFSMVSQYNENNDEIQILC